MKKFAGIKGPLTIKKQCKDLGIDYSDKLWQQGSDYIVITTVKGDNNSGQVLFNTFNGNFFGTTPEGIQFDSANTKHEKEPWFQELLSFFYIEKGAAS